MHKKRAHFLFHALIRGPTKGPNRIHREREYAPVGRISTHMSFGFENLVGFRMNDLLALMLNCLCHSAWGAAVAVRPPYRFQSR